jgi:outer membrane immunogenic protein
MTLRIARSGVGALVSILATVTFCTNNAWATDLRGKEYIAPSEEAEVYQPPSPIWQGLYWGVSAGYGWGTSEQTYDRNDNHGIASTDPEGALGAFTVGYNFVPAPGFLIGAEADLGIMDISADDKEVYDGHVYRTQFGGLWGTIRARAGVILGKALIYGTGGVAFMETDEISIGNTPGETAVNDDLRSGWTVGGGIEYALMPGVTGKVEYLHMDFGTHEGLSDNREDFSFKNEVDLVRAGLNFKF